MHLSAQILLVIGGLLLLGLVTDVAGKRTALPRVALLVLFGMVVGPAGLGWLTDVDDATNAALTRVRDAAPPDAAPAQAR